MRFIVGLLLIVI